MSLTDLPASIRTVEQVSTYLDELKVAAAALAQNVAAQERGYFTPDEEDATLALLGSYWQTRGALLDLIQAMRQEAGNVSSPNPVCFLVAYAAAILLVDAARFLRETVNHRPIVRDKLNEPVAQLGVPAGVYDTIQKSLVSARNGWHLYHALQYFARHREMLRECASSHNAQTVFTIIEERQSRLDVTVQQFARAKLRTRSDQLARNMASALLGQALYGLQKLAGLLLAEKYVRPGHKPGLPASIAQTICQVLVPGDVLVVRKEYALTNYFLPGYWPHAALYVGNADQVATLGVQGHSHVQPRWPRIRALAEGCRGVVLEAMKDGVHLRSLDSPFHSDSVLVLRPKLDPAAIARGIARTMAHEGKPYDFDFDFRRADRLVCTEVVYRAYDGLGAIRLPLTIRAGRPNLSGGDLVRLASIGTEFFPVALYAPQQDTSILSGEKVLDFMKTVNS